MKKYKWFFGTKYSLNKYGYYSTTRGKRLHREIYKYHNGLIPEEYVVHHKDEDKNNNSPSNLIALSKSEHAKIHNSINGMTNRRHTIESIQKMSLGNMVKVRCIDTGIIYKSLSFAGEDTKTNIGNISLVCSGKRQTAGGLKWEYING